MTDSTQEIVPRIARLTSFRVLIIGGPERVEFLQGQLTQDVTKLGASGSALAGWANAKGRLLAFGQLIAVGDAIWWPLPADIIEGVAKRLGMFKLRADVQIEAATLPVAGLLGTALIKELTLGSVNLALADEPQMLSDGSVIARTSGDPDRVWVMGPAAESAGFEQADEHDWMLAGIRCGQPLIVAATQEQFVPQMLNLDQINAISFTKGCYVGQEIVARTQNLGRIKRRMYRFTCAGDVDLSPGATIYGADNATGKIVLVEKTAALSELLAVLPIDHAQGDWFADQQQTLRLNKQSLPGD